MQKTQTSINTQGFNQVANLMLQFRIKLINDYGFDGVDIDLENGVSAQFMGMALRQISAKIGEDLIITMAPQTLDMQSTGREYFKLALDIKDILTVCNTQYYNSGAMLGQDGAVYSQGNVDFITGLAAILLENGLRPDQVGLGLPASPKGAGGGYVEPSVVNEAMKSLAYGTKAGRYQPVRAYPGIRGAMNWSINWDAANGYKFVNTVAPVLKTLPNAGKDPVKPDPKPEPEPKPDPKPEPQNQPPVLAGVGNKTIEFASTFNPLAGVSANDKEDGDLTSKIVVAGKVDTYKAGTYKLTYTVKDSKGLTAIATATITVKAKVVAPDPGPGVMNKQVLVGYWHNFDNGSTNIRLRDIPTEWDVVQVAFGETSKDRAIVEFEPYNATDAEFRADVEYLKSRGVRVLLSLGGQNGVLHIDSPSDVDKFVKSTTDLIDKYGFNGFDIDVENGISVSAADKDLKNPSTPRIKYMIEGINKICDHYGDDFWLTMAPEIAYVQGGITAFAGPWGAYLPIIEGTRHNLTMLHVQHYNCGGNEALDGMTYNAGTADFQVAMVDMLLQGFNIGRDPNAFFAPLRPDQVGIGIPAKPSAAPAGGYIAPAEMTKALDYLIKGKSYGGRYKLQEPAGYPGFRGLMTWSINWDATQGNSFAKTYKAYFNGL